jgi:hypothetical protein
MLLFGHLGVTLGIFIPLLKPSINLKYLAIGALLPDLIDKPIGGLIFASTFANGHIIGHTLLFSCLLTLMGIYLYQKNREIRVFNLAAGSFFHLIEDQMWRGPQTLLWPLLGWSFPRKSIDYTGFEYLLKLLEKSFQPELSMIFIEELMGMVVIVIFAVIWVKKRLNKNSTDRKTLVEKELD